MGCGVTRRKRKLTAPLGSGTAPSLGNRDPRIRRDRVARSTPTPDPGVTADDVSALEARIAELESAAIATANALGEESVETTLSLETGDLTFNNGTYLFTSFGVDGDWTADRYDGTNLDTLQGSGAKPTQLSDFNNLPWPVPAP